MMSEHISHPISLQFDGSRESSRMEKTADAGILMPAQYADLVRRNHTLEGELKLRWPCSRTRSDAICATWTRKTASVSGSSSRSEIGSKAPSQDPRESS